MIENFKNGVFEEIYISYTPSQTDWKQETQQKGTQNIEDIKKALKEKEYTIYFWINKDMFENNYYCTKKELSKIFSLSVGTLRSLIVEKFTHLTVVKQKNVITWYKNGENIGKIKL